MCSGHQHHKGTFFLLIFIWMQRSVKGFLVGGKWAAASLCWFLHCWHQVVPATEWNPSEPGSRLSALLALSNNDLKKNKINLLWPKVLSILEVLPAWWCHTFPDTTTGSGSCSLERPLNSAPSCVGRHPHSISLCLSSLPLWLTLTLTRLLCGHIKSFCGGGSDPPNPCSPNM